MDSPVVLDKASEFGEPIDLDRPFPGFPFDDEGFGRRGDIRAHLDQLAARHPEFADHLLGPAWGDIPFHGSLRTRNRRDSGNGLNNNYQGYSDEDARSQASGSSAASGASAVSSHGEPEGSHNHREKSRDRPDTEHQQFAGRTQIPQYGFRNTVDIGQHRHNMDNPDKGNRGQRSMSAPPENRQQPYQCHHNCQQQQQPLQSQPQPPQPGQRYVSRIDITPQHNQPPQQQPQPQPQPQQPQHQPQPQQPQQPQQQKPASQQQGNVRHIPIFVEGRDEPVLPRNFDEQHFKREPSPTQFHTPPHFQRPSAFGQSPFARPHQWSPHFQDSFYPPETGYEQPPRRQQQTHSFQHPRQQQQQPQYEKQPQYENKPQPQQYEKQAQPQQQRQQYTQHPQQPPQQQQQQQQRQQDASPSRPKQVVPKDPLERVAMVQKEVDSLAEQVKAYTGNSRKDKQYMYLDEMLTRELIKLDDIETEGRENVRQARKNAIKTIQETIGLLESMAPLASQPATPQQTEKPIIATVVDQPESMEVDRKQEEQTNEPIPLPPGPSSPLNKMPEEAVEMCEEEKKEKTTIDAEQLSNPPIDSASVEPMDIAAPVVEKPEEKPTESTPMDVQEGSDGSNLEDKKPNEETVATEVPEQNASDQKKVENDSSSATLDVVPEKPSGESTTNVQPDVTAPEQKIEQQELASEKMEVKQSPKIPKKGKKTKKQTTVSASPVCDTPIPLPPPESTETKAK
ncbi:BAG domain-containing protein starvin isoform X2 [Lasioglossum baleicum]|uniref:BAG domain-containing protein starvin isoform X2 n=1 Tax=Lasioglossum baleicum TaxID=434251 RepID=UPI003FCE1B4D